ncbi:MAG: amino-acid N-acetyltransferase [Candidatus Nanopelagicales bacterium]|nr:amino-acid N-acetyltransferase [Candidatus Nanopelagicales bacterium]
MSEPHDVEYLEVSPVVDVRLARTTDVPRIRRLVDLYAPDRRLLSKATVALYEAVPEFLVAELGHLDGEAEGDSGVTREVVGCGALHVMWEDLAEVRTLAVDPALVGQGIGRELLLALLERARDLGVRRVFVLTFETGFFGRVGFREIEGLPVSREVFGELMRSPDEGIAEFLDIERVKPNTLGNSRMLLRL